MANPSRSRCVVAGADGSPLLANAQANIADASVAYVDDGSANDLDTDAKRVAAMLATNGKINAILDILEAHGLMKDA